MKMTIGQRLGSFEVSAVLGEGGMGEVWRATDTALGREVALKVLPEGFAEDPERHARFEREARVLASLNHPNIATLYGLEHLDGIHVLVMELVEGEGLDELMARGPVAVDDTVQIALQIARALEAAHEAGIVHRDLKPANVRLRPDGTVKVLDFGLAKAWETTSGDSSLSLSPTITSHHTRAGVILGTAAYMSPEQARGKQVDRRADIWAFGVVLWEMLTGRRMFDGETVTDVIAAVITREPDWDLLPDGIPHFLRRLLSRCLRKDPRTRQPDIASVRLELEELGAAGAEEEPTAAPAMVPVRPRSRGRTIAWLAGAVVLLALGGAVGWLATPQQVNRRVVEFQVEPPQGTRFYLDPERPGSAVVSPDGEAIAFTAEEKGVFRLYVRSLSSAVSQPISGTEGAQYPFWSPDSRLLAFFADGKLRKVQIKGGASPPVTICDAEEIKGGSWGSAGMIVFAPNASSPLMRVSESGGAPRSVTQFDPDLKEDSHRHPRFLPDGRHFLYLARVNGGSPDNGVMVSSIDGGPSKLLVRSPAAAEYASGHLLFMRDGTLMAQPFDPSRLELSGEAFPLAEDLNLVAPATALAVFSASADGILVYQTGGSGAARKLVWRDRSGRVTGTLGDEATFWDVALSPGGDQAAVNVSGPAGSADLWLYDIARGVGTRLTFDPHDEWGLAWSPNAKTIAFASDREGHYDLYTIAVGGTQPEQLLYKSDTTKVPDCISPDGRLLMYSEQSRETGWDLWLLPLEGEHTPRPFINTPFDQPMAAFSPDSRWVAYGSNESGAMEVYVVPFPGPGRKWQISTQGGSWPQWRSDGREIFYRGPTGTIFATSIEAGGDTLTIGMPESLFLLATPQSSNQRYFPKPDGSGFLSIEPVDAQVRSPLTVVMNWPAKVPG